MVSVVEWLGGNAVNPPLSAIPPITTVLIDFSINYMLLDEADDNRQSHRVRVAGQEENNIGSLYPM